MSTRRVALAFLCLRWAWGPSLYSRRGADEAPPILGMVRQTEIRIAPEVSGRLASIAVAPGQHVRRGDLLAVIDNPGHHGGPGRGKGGCGQRRGRSRKYLFGHARPSRCRSLPRPCAPPKPTCCWRSSSTIGP